MAIVLSPLNGRLLRGVPHIPSGSAVRAGLVIRGGTVCIASLAEISGQTPDPSRRGRSLGPPVPLNSPQAAGRPEQRK